MRRIATAIVPASAAALMFGHALADDKFSGEAAAYIDWSASNCGMASTDKAHRLVDEANAKDAAGFLRAYEARFKAKELGAALATPSKQEHMCADIKAWFGPLGSRIPDLVKWQGPNNTAAAEKPAPPTGKGHKGRRHPTQ
jgi:hypothetical protein